MQQSEKGYGHIAKVGQDGKYTYEQYYPERKRVIVSQLHEGTHWKKFSAHAEVIVQETICNEFGLTKGKHTEGYAPEYDYLINNKKVEQKISHLETASTDELKRELEGLIGTSEVEEIPELMN